MRTELNDLNETLLYSTLFNLMKKMCVLCLLDIEYLPCEGYNQEGSDFIFTISSHILE